MLLSTLTLQPSSQEDPCCSGGPCDGPVKFGNDPTYVKLIWIHRLAVILSWGFLFPLGVSMVRYFPSGSRLQKHRIVQTVGLCVEIIDFICIVTAHQIGIDGKGPADGNFAGTQGNSPGITHKQRGLAVFICILLQVLLGIFRPSPYPNGFVRRFWLFSHRTIGDGAIVIAWIQIWESVSTLVTTEEGTFWALTIVAFMAMISAMLVAPAYYMLVSTKADNMLENESHHALSVVGSVTQSFDHPSGHDSRWKDVPESPTSDQPRDAMFYGCGHCRQVFTSKTILQVHTQFTHPEKDYLEVLAPMTQRFAEVTNNPAVIEGVPLSEVQIHNHRRDCWVVLNGKVYDLSRFVSAHPGGENPILSWAGRDASRTWNLIHQKSWIDRHVSKGTITCLGPLAPEGPVQGAEGLHLRTGKNVTETSMQAVQPFVD